MLVQRLMEKQQSLRKKAKTKDQLRKLVFYLFAAGKY
jgi:hypothetical protein